MTIPTRSILIVFTRVIFERHHRVRARVLRVFPDLVFERPRERERHPLALVASVAPERFRSLRFHPFILSRTLTQRITEQRRSRRRRRRRRPLSAVVVVVVVRVSRLRESSIVVSRRGHRDRRLGRAERRNDGAISHRANIVVVAVVSRRARARRHHRSKARARSLFRGMSVRAHSRVDSRSFTDGRTNG